MSEGVPATNSHDPGRTALDFYVEGKSASPLSYRRWKH